MGRTWRGEQSRAEGCVVQSYSCYGTVGDIYRGTFLFNTESKRRALELLLISHFVEWHELGIKLRWRRHVPGSYVLIGKGNPHKKERYKCPQ
jgi:hypothetical protein